LSKLDSMLGHGERVDPLDYMLTDLSDLLGKELDLYRSLLSLLQKERRTVVDCSIEDLIQINKKKENLVLKIRILEQSRGALLEKLAQSIGITPEALTLSVLEERLKEPFVSQLRSLRSNLRAILQSIREANEENRVFLKHSVDFVRGSLDLIQHLTLASPTYMASGGLDGDRCDSRFVSEKA
jgi:flagellar biosynthesis/type III secretory pathway chaperone